MKIRFFSGLFRKPKLIFPSELNEEPDITTIGGQIKMFKQILYPASKFKFVYLGSRKKYVRPSSICCILAD